jgi:hypothetical protein
MFVLWAVCILVMQRPGVSLKLLSNKTLFIEKISSIAILIANKYNS